MLLDQGLKILGRTVICDSYSCEDSYKLDQVTPSEQHFRTGAPGAHLRLAVPLLGRTHHPSGGKGLPLAIHHPALCCRGQCNVTPGSAGLPWSLLLLHTVPAAWEGPGYPTAVQRDVG